METNGSIIDRVLQDAEVRRRLEIQVRNYSSIWWEDDALRQVLRTALLDFARKAAELALKTIVPLPDLSERYWRQAIYDSTMKFVFQNGLKALMQETAENLFALLPVEIKSRASEQLGYCRIAEDVCVLSQVIRLGIDPEVFNNPPQDLRDENWQAYKKRVMECVQKRGIPVITSDDSVPDKPPEV